MSFVFYDFETTGIEPEFDQPLQFAAIRATDDLTEEESIDIRCRLSPHILPAPSALAVTGIDPKMLNDPGLPSWFEFVQTLSDLIEKWGPATWVGYNSINFDENVLRHSLYQNLHPNPYLTQIGGNDRMDIMKLVHLVWEIEPDTLNWPHNDSGYLALKLDRLAPENGFENHDAHDALGDVRATLYLAQLIRDRAPMVWEQSLRNRSKHEVNTLLETGQPLRLVERFGGNPPQSYIGAYCGRNSDNPNYVGFLDLESVDPDEFAGVDDAYLAAAVDVSPMLIRTVVVNKCPSLFTLDNPSDEILQRADALADMTDLHHRIGTALAGRYADSEEPEHVEQQIYSGFYSAQDKRLLMEFQAGSWEHRASMLGKFEDQRLQRLGQRAIFLNCPDLLDAKTQKRLNSSIRDRWMSGDPSAPWMTFAKVGKNLEKIQEKRILEPKPFKALKDFYATLRKDKQ